MHIGLSRLVIEEFGDMLTYFLPEILLLFCIMTHIQKEILIGLLDIKEN